MAGHRPPPLSGVRVLELAHLIAGPICGMYLADMGADVVKVESREAPDAGRSVYPRAVRNGEGVLHLTVNRNKRGICLDVKRPEGRDAFLRLAGWADVIIEGFGGGVAERLGIDYDSVKGANPRLIYCSISAFGPDGPWREKPGLDSLAQALGGLMAITGEPAGGPVLCGAPVADTLGGMLAIQGILTALISRAGTGQGQRVDASLLNGMLFANRKDRLTQRGELEAILAPVFRARPVAQWMETLEQADVLCAPVNDYPGLVRHPQVVATGFITEQAHPRAGRFKTVATPVKLDKTPGPTPTPPPLPPHHTPPA